MSAGTSREGAVVDEVDFRKLCTPETMQACSVPA